mgnify:FL=1
MPTKATKTTKTTKATAASNGKMELFKKLEETKLRQASLEQALGRIRVDIMNLTFPGEHRETVDNVMKIVDNAMKSI